VPSRCRPPRAPANLVVAALAFSCFAFDTSAQSRAGSRDLAGVWNYATMTPLEREFAERETLTEAEALA
jgi:hypothetical protein